MPKRLDIVKSLLRSAAKAGADRVGATAALRRFGEAYRDLRSWRVSISESALLTAVADAPGVSSASVHIQDGMIHVDTLYKADVHRAFSLRPHRVFFAPRGAKEILFVVEPPELARDGRVREAVARVATLVAWSLWGAVLSMRPGPEQVALAERDAEGIRVDLRSIPAVQSALASGAAGLFLDVMAPEAFVLDKRALTMQLARPALG